MPLDPTSTNLALWLREEPTDPSFVKPITGKAYRGSSPNPTYLVKRMTQAFGPVGLGWGYTAEFQDVHLEGGSVVNFCHLSFWYYPAGCICTHETFATKDSVGTDSTMLVPVWRPIGPKSEILTQVGGTEFAGVRKKSGDAFADEDARKKSLTDALTKMASHIGFAGDIFLGRWDDNKYLAERQEEEAAANRQGAVRQQAETKRIAAQALVMLQQKVGQLVDALGRCDDVDAFLALRADAGNCRVKLVEGGHQDLVKELGAAVAEATARMRAKRDAA